MAVQLLYFVALIPRQNFWNLLSEISSALLPDFKQK